MKEAPSSHTSRGLSCRFQVSGANRILSPIMDIYCRLLSVKTGGFVLNLGHSAQEIRTMASELGHYQTGKKNILRTENKSLQCLPRIDSGRAGLQASRCAGIPAIRSAK